MKNEQDTEQKREPRDHLKRLRDFLDLPFSALKDDELVFLLADECHVVVSYTRTGHISLICDLGRLDALSVDNWRSLIAALSAGYDYAFPASPVATDGRLALVWAGDADMETDRWLRRAEDALTCAVGIHATLKAGNR